MKKNILIYITIIFGLLASLSTLGARHFVHLKANDVHERSLIANHIHIDQVLGTSVYATVNEFELKEIKKHFPGLIIETHSLKKEKATRERKGSKVIDFPRKDSNFHTYKEMNSKLDSLAKKYPKITKRFSIGKTVEKREISAIRISGISARPKNSFIPAILFIGSHHAREHLSTEVPLLLLEHILKSYKTNKHIKKLVNSRDIYFIPMLNPDGAMHDIKGKKYKMWRKNRSFNKKTRGVDLNRNYSKRWGEGGSSKKEKSDVYMGPKPFSEPETIAIKKFVEKHPNIRMMLSFHTFSKLILYPWSGTEEEVGGKDQDVFETMAKKMATWNGYKPMKSSKLYIATGDTCDWAYATHGIFCFTFELRPASLLGGGFYPGQKVILPTFKENIKPALYMIEHTDDPYKVLKK